MVKKYIDGDELYDAILENWSGINMCMLSDILEFIEDTPTADVVEVVRCKDCKHFDTDAFRRTVCVRDFQIICVKDNDFCSYGKKIDKE